jgi:hypothetical protein
VKKKNTATPGAKPSSSMAQPATRTALLGYLAALISLLPHCLVHSLAGVDFVYNGFNHAADNLTLYVSHPIFRRKPNASHMCARIKISHI